MKQKNMHGDIMRSVIDHAYASAVFGRLHYIVTGPVDGECIILLHGFPEFWYGWRSQIPALAEAGYHVAAPDQRGYNLSDKPKGAANYKLDLLADDMLVLIKHLGRKKVHLVGHDWGGIVAWHFAEKYPEYLHKLVILNAPHPKVMNETVRSSLEQLRKSWYILFFQLPWLPEWLLSLNYHHNAARMLEDVHAPDRFSGADIAAYREAWSQPGAWTATINWYRAALRHPPTTLHQKQIPVPTLVIWGKKDAALSHEMAQPSVDLCAQGRLVFLEDATHWVQHDQPEQVNELILGFLNKHGA